MDDLTRALGQNRDAVAKALEAARKELDRKRHEVADLEAQVHTAEAVLRLTGAEGPAVQEVSTLREAMKAALADEPEGLPAPALAEKIREMGIYKRPNGRPVDLGQVHNRVHHYEKEFLRGHGRIKLVAGFSRDT